MHDSDWLKFPVIIVNFNAFFIHVQPAPDHRCFDTALNSETAEVVRVPLCKSAQPVTGLF